MLAFIIPRRGIKFFLAALPMKNMICNHDESVLQLSFKKKKIIAAPKPRCSYYKYIIYMSHQEK